MVLDRSQLGKVDQINYIPQPSFEGIKEEIKLAIESGNYTGNDNVLKLLEDLFFDQTHPEKSRRKIENILRFYTKYNIKDKKRIKKFDDEKRTNYPLDSILKNGEDTIEVDGDLINRKDRIAKSILNFSGKRLTNEQLEKLLELHHINSKNYDQFEMTSYVAGKYVQSLQEVGLTYDEVLHLTNSGILGFERFFSMRGSFLNTLAFFSISAATFESLNFDEQLVLFGGYMTLGRIISTMGIDEMTSDDPKVMRSYVRKMYFTGIFSVIAGFLSWIAKTGRFDDIPGAENLGEIPLAMSIPIVITAIYDAYKKSEGSLQSTEGRGGYFGTKN